MVSRIRPLDTFATFEKDLYALHGVSEADSGEVLSVRRERLSRHPGGATDLFSLATTAKMQPILGCERGWRGRAALSRQPTWRDN